MVRSYFLNLLLRSTRGSFNRKLLNEHGIRCIYSADLQFFALDPTDRKFLFARNGFLLILVRKLLCQNPRYFYLRKTLLHCSLSLKEWTSKLHSSSIVRNIILRDWTYVLDLSNLLRQLVSTFCDVIKGMYDANGIDTKRLDSEIACILQRFLSNFQEQGISLIDIFAVFNTFRKGFYFNHDGRYFRLNFDSTPSIKLERKKMVITLDSSTFFQKLSAIMGHLASNPVQHDLLFLMYRTILRDPNHRVQPCISFPFQLTISENYRVWLSFLNWETTRYEYLYKCKLVFVSWPSFSSKSVDWYRRAFNTDTSSFRIFFQNSHISERYSGSEKISFEPI